MVSAEKEDVQALSVKSPSLCISVSLERGCPQTTVAVFKGGGQFRGPPGKCEVCFCLLQNSGPRAHWRTLNDIACPLNVGTSFTQLNLPSMQPSQDKCNRHMMCSAEGYPKRTWQITWRRSLGTPANQRDDANEMVHRHPKAACETGPGNKFE